MLSDEKLQLKKNFFFQIAKLFVASCFCESLPAHSLFNYCVYTVNGRVC